MNSLSNEYDRHSYYFDESEERCFCSPDLNEIILILDCLCSDIVLIEIEQCSKSKESNLYYIAMFLDKAINSGIEVLRQMKLEMLTNRENRYKASLSPF